MAKKKPSSVCPPPSHLGERSAALWRCLVPALVQAPQQLQMLLVALEALDRAEAARERIATDGMVLTSKAGLAHVHPLIKVERDSQALFARCWSSLHLHLNPRFIDVAMADMGPFADTESNG